MPGVSKIGVAEATSGTVNTDRSEITRRGTGRAGDRTFPADLARRAAIDDGDGRRDSSRGGYVPRRSRCHIVAADGASIRGPAEGRDPRRILARAGTLLGCRAMPFEPPRPSEAPRASAN